MAKSDSMRNEVLMALRSFIIAAGASAAATFVGVYGVFIGATAVDMGWLQSTSNAISNSGQLIWGRISDRVGKRAPFIIIASIASAIYGYTWLSYLHRLCLFSHMPCYLCSEQ